MKRDVYIMFVSFFAISLLAPRLSFAEKRKPVQWPSASELRTAQKNGWTQSSASNVQSGNVFYVKENVSGQTLVMDTPNMRVLAAGGVAKANVAPKGSKGLPDIAGALNNLVAQPVMSGAGKAVAVGQSILNRMPARIYSMSEFTAMAQQQMAAAAATVGATVTSAARPVNNTTPNGTAGATAAPNGTVKAFPTIGNPFTTSTPVKTNSSVVVRH